MIAIPRSGRTEHVLQNWAVKDVVLTDEEYAALDRAFPAPEHKTIWILYRISCEKKYCENITKTCGNDYIVLK